jgi:hypothetical protein
VSRSSPMGKGSGQHWPRLEPKEASWILVSALLNPMS